MDREAAARYGLNVADIQDVIEMVLGGKAATQLWEGERHFGVAVRLKSSERNIAIADHLWDALEQMASEMGIDRDGLVNQALFTFARLNGYMMPGQPNGPPGLTDAPAGAGRNGSYGPTSDLPMPDRPPATDRGAQLQQADSSPPAYP